MDDTFLLFDFDHLLHRGLVYSFIQMVHVYKRYNAQNTNTIVIFVIVIFL